MRARDAVRLAERLARRARIDLTSMQPEIVGGFIGKADGKGLSNFEINSAARAELSRINANVISTVN